MRQPTISVIIPTRERKDTLEHALRTVVMQNYDALQIIVSDNCSVDGTEDVVRQFKDPRIIYLNTGRRLSMSANWEFALGHVTGTWVGIIGDDDGLLPRCCEELAEIVSGRPEKAVRSRTCSYEWPSLTGKRSGLLEVPLGVGNITRTAVEALQAVLDGEASYLTLPTLYNGGFAHIDLINIDRAKGHFFLSSIPDVYSSIALSDMVDSYIYVQKPLAINGASKNSTGTAFFGKTSAAGLGTSASKFLSEPNIPFHHVLPVASNGAFPRSLQVLVYESYLQRRERHAGVATTTAAAQLRIIMKEAVGDQALQDWRTAFAERHGLQSELAKPIEPKPRRNMLQRLRSLSDYNMITVTSEDNPIRDVYQASVVADATLDKKYNDGVVIAANIAHRFRRLI